MNKARRQELKMLKYKKRLRLTGKFSMHKLAEPRGVENGLHYNFTAYRSAGKPCSCSLCSPLKYNRAAQRQRVNER